MQIQKPIFVVGVPRSGTTMLYRLIAQHPDLGWFSKIDLKEFPTKEYLRFAYLRRRIFEVRNMHYPIDFFNRRFFTTVETPIEMSFLWDTVFQKDWECKVSEYNLEILKKTMIKILQKKNKKIFLSKVPKNSIRIMKLKEIFPDSKFIHIVRDPRGVVNSMIKRSLENPNGYFGIPLKKSETKRKNLEMVDLVTQQVGIEQNKVETHSMQWKQIVEEIKQSSKDLGSNRYMEIKYEDFVEHPKEYLERIVKFCELPHYDFLYKKDNITYNLDGKNKLSWEFITMRQLVSMNKTHVNDSEILKYTSPIYQDYRYN